MATAAGTKEFTNISPPDDWELNNFLLEISDMLEEEDLRKLKSLCTGKGGFGRGILERLTSPLDFFDLLRQTEKLTRHNLLYLQCLIWSVGRKDIHKKFVAFGREMKEALHFYAPKDTPENGYKYLKFHVGGDTKCYSIKSLRDLKAHVARLLRVPENFIFVGGIEPSSSLLITFMVPEDVVYVIEGLTEDEKRELLQYDIDKIVMDDKITPLQGTPMSYCCLDEALERKKLLEKELRLEQEIESLQIKLFEANKALNKHQNLDSSQVDVWLIWLAFLYRVYCATSRSRLSPQVPSCRTITARFLQRRMLLRCRELGYDENIICNLMDAAAMIVTEEIRVKEEVAITSLLQRMKTLQNENVVLKFKIEKMQFYSRVKDDDKVLSTRDEFFLTHVLQKRPIRLDVQMETVELDRNHITHVLKTLSKRMSKIDRRKILNSAKLTPKEETAVQANPDQLLLTILSKDPQTATINIFAWLERVLHPLGNQELVQKGFDMLHEGTKKTKSGQLKQGQISWPRFTNTKKRTWIVRNF